jgi:hypothetical protein
VITGKSMIAQIHPSQPRSKVAPIPAKLGAHGRKIRPFHPIGPACSAIHTERKPIVSGTPKIKAVDITTYAFTHSAGAPPS